MFDADKTVQKHRSGKLWSSTNPADTLIETYGKTSRKSVLEAVRDVGSSRSSHSKVPTMEMVHSNILAYTVNKKYLNQTMQLCMHVFKYPIESTFSQILFSLFKKYNI